MVQCQISISSAYWAHVDQRRWRRWKVSDLVRSAVGCRGMVSEVGTGRWLSVTVGTAVCWSWRREVVSEALLVERRSVVRWFWSQ